jgi:hypothetical protein
MWRSSPRNSVAHEIESESEMSRSEYETAVAEFIRSKGINRCPTVCLAPTHGSVAIEDRVALRQRAEQLEELRVRKTHRVDAAFLR